MPRSLCSSFRSRWRCRALLAWSCLLSCGDVLPADAVVQQQGLGNTAGIRIGWPSAAGGVVLDGVRQERVQDSSATLLQAGRDGQAVLWQRDLAASRAVLRQEAGGRTDSGLIQQASGAHQQAELLQAGEGQGRAGSIQQFGHDLQARLRQEQGASVADLEQSGSQHVLDVRLAGAAHGLRVLQQGVGMQAVVDLDSATPASLDLLQRGSGHVAYLRLRDTAGYQRIEQEGQDMRLHVEQAGMLQVLRVRQR